MNEAYYVLEDGEKTGPFSYQELIEREIDIDTQISTPEDETWQNASYLPEFIEYFESQGYNFPTEDNLAGFGWRVLAFCIDNILVSYLLSNLQAFGLNIPQVRSLDEFRAIPIKSIIIWNLTLYAVFLIYNTLFESSALKGSIGKIICRIEVVDEDGRKLSLLGALKRNFGAILSSMISGLPFLTFFFSQQNQTWYDKLVNAYIIHKKTPQAV